MIKRSKIASPGRRNKENPAKASDELMNYLTHDYPDQLPISYITAITKKYNKERVIRPDDKFIQRFVSQKGFVHTSKIAEYIKNVPTYQRGQPLPEESVRRIYTSSANNEGKLTAESLIRMANEVGVDLSDKQAFDMIKKYGKRKQHLSVQDCLKLNSRRKITTNSKSARKQRL